MTPEEALDLKFYSNDLNGEVTIRQYMAALLSALFSEGESFSGKRPLGNSGWETDIYVPLVREGLIKGEYHEDVYEEDDHVDRWVDKYSYQKADAFVQKMIAALASG